MGYLSVLLVQHDALHEIREEAELGRKVYKAIVGFNRRDQLHHVSDGIKIIAGNIHASDFGTIAVEGNTAYHLEEALFSDGSLPSWSKAESHLVDLVKRLGYKVTRSKKK